MLIEDLEMSVRTTNCLKRAGILTVDDLQRADLFKVRNLGRKSLEEILSKMNEISMKLEQYDIIPMEILYKFRTFGYDCIDDIAMMRAFDIISILEFNEDDYRTVVTSLFGKGIELNEYKKGNYDSIEQYIDEKVKEHIYVDITKFISDEKIVRFLQEKHIDNMGILKKCTFDELVGYGMTKKDVNELKYQLAHKHFSLKNDRIEKCALCGGFVAYVSQTERLNNNFCYDCKNRVERLANKKEIDISVNSPVSTQFSSGKKGFYIMANISNISRKVVNVRLVDLYFVSLSRKWVPDSTLDGYTFGDEQLLPESLKSVAKIWTSGYWSYRELDEKDYLVIELIINEKQKQIFKFIYLNKRWIEFDFYSQKLK